MPMPPSSPVIVAENQATPKAAEPLFGGASIGRTEGSTLVGSGQNMHIVSVPADGLEGQQGSSIGQISLILVLSAVFLIVVTRFMGFWGGGEKRPFNGKHQSSLQDNDRQKRPRRPF